MALVWRVACDAFLQVQTGSRQRQRARGRGPVAPGASEFPRALASFGTVAVQYKTATTQTAPGQAVAFRPPADTTRVPGCRYALPQALRVLWSSAVMRRERYAASRIAGSTTASLAKS